MIPRQAIELIKRWEGLELSAYQDSAGIWTIGYGTTSSVKGVRVTKGLRIDKETAEEWLIRHLEHISIQINKLLQVSLYENQYSAILSFVYNVGIGAFSRSTLLKRLNNNDFDVENEFLKWTKVTKDGKKVELQGLVNRRKDESNLFKKKGKKMILISQSKLPEIASRIAPGIREQIENKIRSSNIPVLTIEPSQDVKEPRYGITFLTTFIIAASVIIDIILSYFNIKTAWKLIWNARTTVGHIKLVYIATKELIKSIPQAWKEIWDLDKREREEIGKLIEKALERIQTPEIEKYK